MDDSVALEIVPLTLRQANDMVLQWHRHHRKVAGLRFAIGVRDINGMYHGAAIVGRPVACEISQYLACEVTRLVTDGAPNACSMLYAACARAAKAMGYKFIQTYILENEPGTSLKASGWIEDHITSGGLWNGTIRSGRCEDQPNGPKRRFRLTLNPPLLARVV